MKKELGVKPWLYPMPTYMIGTYNEDDTVDVMMMAWGGICAEDMVALNLEEDHKTVANLKARGAFTLSVPGRDQPPTVFCARERSPSPGRSHGSSSLRASASIARRFSIIRSRYSLMSHGLQSTP